MPGTKSSEKASVRILPGRQYASRRVLWRSAFQAHRSSIALPRTSSPVTVATLRTAFQAVNAISVLLFS